MNYLAIFIILLSSISLPVQADKLDNKISLIKEVYKLEPKNCKKTTLTNQSLDSFNTGKLLFESVSLSGNRDISCSSCHLDKFGTADGLPMAIGVGGKGEGKQRAYNNTGALVQRNALSLHARGDINFTAFFWDGKVQKNGHLLISQFGDKIENKFNNTLALASALPLIERDEFLGETSLFHENDIQFSVGNKVYYDRYVAVSTALRERFLNPYSPEDREISSALQKLDIPLNKLELSHIGNLLSVFISNNFICQESNWDKYLHGQTNALTDSQKNGAIIFYGKGRCSACHTGNLFSDFDFHSIGTPQGSLGPHTRKRDIGRAAVTHRNEDMFKFRTPPLISVKDTAPYGHNGAFTNIKSVLIQHFNPLDFYISNPNFYNADYYSISKLISSRDKILSTIDIKSPQEISDLVNFLNAL